MSAGPRDFVCPACSACAGKPCTRPTDFSRVPVSWHHLARESLAAAAEAEAQP